MPLRSFRSTRSIHFVVDTAVDGTISETFTALVTCSIARTIAGPIAQRAPEPTLTDDRRKHITPAHEGDRRIVDAVADGFQKDGQRTVYIVRVVRALIKGVGSWYSNSLPSFLPGYCARLLCTIAEHCWRPKGSVRYGRVITCPCVQGLHPCIVSLRVCSRLQQARRTAIFTELPTSGNFNRYD